MGSDSLSAVECVRRHRCGFPVSGTVRCRPCRCTTPATTCLCFNALPVPEEIWRGRWYIYQTMFSFLPARNCPDLPAHDPSLCLLLTGPPVAALSPARELLRCSIAAAPCRTALCNIPHIRGRGARAGGLGLFRPLRYRGHSTEHMRISGEVRVLQAGAKQYSALDFAYWAAFSHHFYQLSVLCRTPRQCPG